MEEEKPKGIKQVIDENIAESKKLVNKSGWFDIPHTVPFDFRAEMRRHTPREYEEMMLNKPQLNPGITRQDFLAGKPFYIKKNTQKLVKSNNELRTADISNKYLGDIMGHNEDYFAVRRFPAPEELIYFVDCTCS